MDCKRSITDTRRRSFYEQHMMASSRRTHNTRWHPRGLPTRVAGSGVDVHENNLATRSSIKWHKNEWWMSTIPGLHVPSRPSWRRPDRQQLLYFEWQRHYPGSAIVLKDYPWHVCSFVYFTVGVMGQRLDLQIISSTHIHLKSGEP